MWSATFKEQGRVSPSFLGLQSGKYLHTSFKHKHMALSFFRLANGKTYLCVIQWSPAGTYNHTSHYCGIICRTISPYAFWLGVNVLIWLMPSVNSQYYSYISQTGMTSLYVHYMFHILIFFFQKGLKHYRNSGVLFLESELRFCWIKVLLIRIIIIMYIYYYFQDWTMKICGRFNRLVKKGWFELSYFQNKYV